MRKHRSNQLFTLIITCSVLLTSTIAVGTLQTPIGFVEADHSSQPQTAPSYILKNFTRTYLFSQPTILTDDEHIWVYVNETNFNMIKPQQPVLPAFIDTSDLMFGTKITAVEYTHAPIQIINLTRPLKTAEKTPYDSQQNPSARTSVLNDDIFPADWVLYHTGGGLSENNHTTFVSLRIYPVRYKHNTSQLFFISNITVTVFYEEPAEPLLNPVDIYDLLIVAPRQFIHYLQPLVEHKEKFGVKTRLVDLSEIYEQMFWYGRDNAEKIKYYIKHAIEHWDVHHVLLVGGIKRQLHQWNLPVRYSRVVPPEEQEYAEEAFLSDLYFADIYTSIGTFSTWDSNQDNRFSVWNETFQEEMDLYPDVYLGRLPCRNIFEVKIMVNKIITYEKEPCDTDWFKNLILVAGDSYNDTNHFNEGELISEEAIQLMPDFNPIRVYASDEMDINRKTVNNAMNQGAGFAYFCGHGSPKTWTTHFPDNGTEWTTGYKLKDMIYLRNKHKLPIVVVGGCHNGQFNTTLMNILIGIREEGLGYFDPTPGSAGGYWYNQWVPNCWAWWLTSKRGGGGIATIANTGLGTHGDGDQDNNGIADYLEVLDGWLELKFLELYGTYQKTNLGQNHADSLTGYLHRFIGNNEKMDTKMVQQWQLFGDPSLQIGGYETESTQILQH